MCPRPLQRRPDHQPSHKPRGYGGQSCLPLEPALPPARSSHDIGAKTSIRHAKAEFLSVTSGLTKASPRSWFTGARRLLPGVTGVPFDPVERKSRRALVSTPNCTPRGFWYCLWRVGVCVESLLSSRNRPFCATVTRHTPELVASQRESRSRVPSLVPNGSPGRSGPCARCSGLEQSGAHPDTYQLQMRSRWGLFLVPCDLFPVRPPTTHGLLSLTPCGSNADDTEWMAKVYREYTKLLAQTEKKFYCRGGILQPRAEGGRVCHKWRICAVLEESVCCPKMPHLENGCTV